MKAALCLLSLLIVVPANAAAGPRKLSASDLNVAAVEEIAEGGGPTHAQHPGEKVQVVCDAVDQRVVNCRALQDWAKFYATPLMRKVRLKPGISGPVQIDFYLTD